MSCTFITGSTWAYSDGVDLTDEHVDADAVVVVVVVIDGKVGVSNLWRGNVADDGLVFWRALRSDALVCLCINNCVRFDLAGTLTMCFAKRAEVDLSMSLLCFCVTMMLLLFLSLALLLSTYLRNLLWLCCVKLFTPSVYSSFVLLLGIGIC